MKHTRIIFVLLLLLATLILSGCHTPSPDNADTSTTPAETTPALTTPSESDIRTAEYDFELWGYGPVIKIDDAGERYVQLDLLVSCVSGRDYYISSHSFSPARGWLLLPDIAAIIPSAPQNVTVTPTQIDVNAGDSFNVSLRFYDLPENFDVGSYDFLVSEYDDATGDSDHDKRLFENVEVGLCTAKYDFELQGDVILGPGHNKDFLSGTIACTVICTSGREYHWSSGGFIPVSRAELITPDGTIYTYSPFEQKDVSRVNVHEGESFKTYLAFSSLPQNFSPGKYDILVYLSDSAELFEDVTVRFETTDAPPAINIPSFSESLASPADIKRVGIKMGGVIVEGLEKVYGICATDENNNYVTFDWYYTRNYEELLGNSAVVRYSPDYEVIVNLENVYYSEQIGDTVLQTKYASYNASKNRYEFASTPPTIPGVYLMEIIVGVWSPWLAEMEPERAPQLPPKQPNTVYPGSYAYYFTVIVE